MNATLLAALERLPHGPEFRFLDRLTRLDPGLSGAGEYTVRGDEPYLRGHFPGDPMLPGVLALEAAQLAGLKLTAIRSAKMLGTARPGERLELEARILARMGNLVQATVTATVSDRLILQTELTMAGR